MPPLGDSWTLTGKSGAVYCGSLLLSLGSWCTQVSVYALQESISQSCVSSGSCIVGLMVTSSKRAYAIPRSAAPSAPVPAPATGSSELYLHRRCSNTVLSQSLWGPRVLWTQDLFESSRHLWWEWGLSLNLNSPLLLSCWGFSFVLGIGDLLIAAPAPAILMRFLFWRRLPLSSLPPP